MARTPPDEEHGLPSLSLVLGYIAVKNLADVEDQIRVLARLGYGNAEIGRICNLAPRTVKMMKGDL